MVIPVPVDRPETLDLEPIPFTTSTTHRVSGDAEPLAFLAGTSMDNSAAPLPQDDMYTLPWGYPARQLDQSLPPENADLAQRAPLPGDAQVASHWATPSHPSTSLRIDVDRVQVSATEAQQVLGKAKVAAPPKKRAPRIKKSVIATVASNEALPSADVLIKSEVYAVQQAKRKSEIERKSRQKRVNPFANLTVVMYWQLNIGGMKARVAQLEQTLLHLIRQQSHGNQQLLQQENAYATVPDRSRLAKLRELLARLFRDSVDVRTEQVQLYQQLENYVAIKEALTNVMTGTTFSDPLVYDLLARWMPPSDAKCIELATESMNKILSFTFTKRSVTDHYAGWQLTYDQTARDGCKFMIDRKMTGVDVASLVQSVWDARATSDGANALGGGLCKAHMSILKAVSKDMVVVNRSLTFAQFTLRAVYLLFRTEINGQIYVVSRELGSAQDLILDQVLERGLKSETVREKWIDVFSWSTFKKVPHDPHAQVAIHPSKSKAKNKTIAEENATYHAMYGGWWGTAYDMGLQRWLMEMLFMVVRWENVYVQPRLLAS